MQDTLNRAVQKLQQQRYPQEHLLACEQGALVACVRHYQASTTSAKAQATMEIRTENWRKQVEVEKEQIRQREQGFWRRLRKTRLVIKLEQRP